ncbi:MAG: hypothetical protein ACP5U1_11660, partial [Desulfomonilaceae bacterium]
RKLDKLKDKNIKLHDELAEKTTRLTMISASLESVRLRLSDVQISFSNLVEELHSREVEFKSAESDLTNCTARQIEALERQQAVKKDLDSLLQSKLAAETKLKEREIRRAEFSVNESQLVDQISRSQALIVDLEKETKAQTKCLDQIKQDLFASLQKISHSNNRIEQNLKRQKEFKIRLSKLEIDSVAQSEALKKLVKQIDLIEDNNLKIADLLAKIEFEMESHRKNQSLIGSELKIQLEKLRTTEEAFISVRTRLETLREEIGNYSCYGSGTQFVMKNFSPLKNLEVLEPIAEIVQCSPEYYLALTSVLDTQLGAIIVKDFPRALELAQKIQQEEGVSRVTFVSLDGLPNNGQQPVDDRFEHLKRLSDVVIVKPAFQELFKRLLKDVYVVEDLAEVKESFGSWSNNIKLVTLNGEIIIPDQLVSVGPIEAMGKNVLAMKLEMESLFVNASDLEKEIAELKKAVNEKESKLQELSRVIEQKSQRKTDLKIDQTRNIKDIERLKLEKSRLMSVTRSIELDQKGIRDELDQLSQEQTELATQIAFLKEENLSLNNRKAGLDERVQQLVATLRKENQSLNENRINLVKIEERKKSLDKDSNSTRNFLKNCERQISNLGREAEYLSKQVEHLAKEKMNFESCKQQLSGILGKLQTERAKTKDLFDSLQNDSVRLSQEELLISRAATAIKDQLHQTELEIARLEETLKNSIQKTLERYDVDPLSLGDPSVVPDENDLVRIRSKIESLGEVNLAAISESQQVNTRLSFLVGQENDLKDAVKSLFSTIEKIDRTTAQRLHTTFQEINLKFREIFSSLFNGGEAWLELIGSENTPDQGVNIMVKPPGKKLQNMDLLSGGEKALTAIAFIFAIFLYRPSSFCLLDEVDAPLDDSNVNRFNQMLRELSRSTQFVVITHNKKSMENSDCLFGVTSGGSGASTLVSVKFSE